MRPSHSTRHFRVLSPACLAICLMFLLSACSGGDRGGKESDARASWVKRWNQIAIDASGRDHAPGSARENMGPGRSSRAIAIAQIAVFDAVNAIEPRFRSYALTSAPRPDADMKAAVAQAAHDALSALFPSQQSIFTQELAADLGHIADGPAKEAGIALGAEAADAILSLRTNDGSEIVESYEFSSEPGKWRPDPINPDQRPVGSQWMRVIPLALSNAAQFRLPPPPAMDSPEYATAFNEVKRLGGDGVNTSTERTEDQTLAGIFWAYDGTPSLCAPPRLYNQIAVQLFEQEGGGDIVDFARYLALVNVAMADAGVAIWDSKFYYNVWRPVTGIREADEGTGPSGQGDGNPETIGDPHFTPLGAPASNLAGPNFTPPFPAYPSGHAGFGAALFETARNYFGRDDIEFTFVSDELNGVTKDADGSVRPLSPRTFSSLSQAEEENGQSRIYLGIHWAFDKTGGITQGRQVADFVFENAFQPLQ